MLHTALTKNPSKKPTIFTSIQITHHQSLKKFHNQLKKDSFLSSSKDIFQESVIYNEKCLKTVDIKLYYNINNQNKKKRKRNIYLVQSIIQQVH